jgi:hypothetical protein
MCYLILKLDFSFDVHDLGLRAFMVMLDPFQCINIFPLASAWLPIHGQY